MLCPCHSKKPYESCCKDCHLGKKAENALELMRSRYSAYAKGLTDYIILTTDPNSSQFKKDKLKWKQEILQFSRATCFEGLEILSFEEKQDLAFVTFVAYLSQQGKDATFTERSTFRKVNGAWTYSEGLTQVGAIKNLS